MNLKLRFAVLFTSFVAIILLFSTATIYWAYSGYRSEDYFNRIRYEGDEVYRIYKEFSKQSKVLKVDDVRKIHDKALFQEELIVLDEKGKILFSITDNPTYYPQPFPPKMSRQNTYSFTDAQEAQHVITYVKETKSYICTSGFDKTGLNRLKTLKIILRLVFFGALLLTAIISFLFVHQAVKPIVLLSNQMQKTNEQNLSERIEVQKANDEVNAIARNFNSMLERLRNAFAAQKSFVHYASHELRTPLAVMLSQTEAALKRSYSIDEYKQVLLSLKEDQQQMVELTNSLLLISQCESEDRIDNWPCFRIDELLYDAISMAKRIFSDIQIELSFTHIPDNDDMLVVRGSETLLKSALMNLIKNAYTYSEDQRVKILLVPGNDLVELQLKNRGIQLSAEEREKMTIPFFRGANAQNKKGFGLGLSIIEKIIMLHKGSVQYTAEADLMNCFTLIIPVCPLKANSFKVPLPKA